MACDASPERLRYTIGRHAGSREPLRALFALAEDSPEQLAAYLDLGEVLTASNADGVLGHIQIIDTEQPDQLEIKSMAVDPGVQGRGIGRALVEAALELARDQGRCKVVVATASADTGNLRFYQRLGLRLERVVPDAFTPATGYPAGIEIDGIPLRDQVWLSINL